MTILAVESELNRKDPAQSLTTKWAFDPDEEVIFSGSTLLAAIINRAASFCVLYTDPDYFKLMSDAWWDKWESSFLAWFKTMQMEYNPIENYDRHEQWHDDIVDDNTVKQTGTVNTDANNTDTTTVSAYDSSSFSNKDKVTSVIDSTDERDLTDKIDNDRDLDHEGRIHGNIGVVTSQKMVEDELKLRYNNLYNMVADVFIKELLIAVY
ncbi:MAG: hypothetical protein J6S67_24620 [Methanobrevibacter sp.]|nr:hypothetical protein [Methanobrevibacter sp.]